MATIEWMRRREAIPHHFYQIDRKLTLYPFDQFINLNFSISELYGT